MRVHHLFSLTALSAAALAACSSPPSGNASRDVQSSDDARLEFALPTMSDDGIAVASELEATRQQEPPRAMSRRPPEVAAPEAEPAAAADPHHAHIAMDLPAPQLTVVAAPARDVVPVMLPAGGDVTLEPTDGSGGKGTVMTGGERPGGPAVMPGVIIRGGRGEGVIDPCAIHIPRPGGDALINERAPRPGLRGAPGNLPGRPGGMGGPMRGGIR